jgi:phage recombination protein Bet
LLRRKREGIMGNELTTTQKETRLAMPAPEFSNDQIRLLGETVAKGCDQNELAFFLQVAKLKRLDPFTGQIHVVKRWDSMAGKDKITIQTGIDGFRVIAARTDELAGIDDPEYDTEEGEHPNVAKVTVYRYGRNDEKITYKATARWSEYAQTKRDGGLGPMWKKLPWLMLGKCAESLALRKAFPDELSGMYTNEEMEQADNDQPGAPAGKPQVQMPRSTDEKKADLAKQQAKAETVKQNPPAAQQGAAQGQPKAEEISGEIEKVSPGKGAQEGTLWLVVNKKVICVPANLIDAEMCVGAKILVTAVELKGGQLQKYMATSIEMLVAPAVTGEIIDAEYADVEEKTAEDKPKGTDPVLDEARAAGLGGIFDEAPGRAKAAPAAQTAPAGEATRPGTAGMKRAQRLHTLITQNSKNTGFSEDHLKKYLATQRLEHARDLACPPKGSEAFNAYEYACSMAVGEVDWHEVLDD